MSGVLGLSDAELRDRQRASDSLRDEEERVEADDSRRRMQMLGLVELVREARTTALQCEPIIGPFIKELVLELCARLESERAVAIEAIRAREALLVGLQGGEGGG